MAATGNSYIVELTESALKWGTHRYTSSRGVVYGEGYLPLPQADARSFGIVNSNGTGGADILGKNIFNVTTSDGYLSGVLKAEGCNAAGDSLPKQFAGNNNLKALGDWYNHINAEVGTKIKVEWTSPNDMKLTAL